MLQEKMSFEAATEEVEKWLDHKRVKPADRAKLKGQIETLVGAIQWGDASLDGGTMEITQKLLFPLNDTVNKDNVVLDKIVYKPRITVGDLNEASKNVQATDFDGKVLAYMSALSGAAINYIKKLDSEDLKIGQAVVVFFM